MNRLDRVVVRRDCSEVQSRVWNWLSVSRREGRGEGAVEEGVDGTMMGSILGLGLEDLGGQRGMKMRERKGGGMTRMKGEKDGRKVVVRMRGPRDQGYMEDRGMKRPTMIRDRRRGPDERIDQMIMERNMAQGGWTIAIGEKAGLAEIVGPVSILDDGTMHSRMKGLDENDLAREMVRGFLQISRKIGYAGKMVNPARDGGGTDHDQRIGHLGATEVNRESVNPNEKSRPRQAVRHVEKTTKTNGISTTIMNTERMVQITRMILTLIQQKSLERRRHQHPLPRHHRRL